MYLEYGLITFILLLLEAMNNAKYSTQASYMSDIIVRANRLLSLQEAAIEYLPKKVEYWNTEAKIIKGSAIVFVLIIYGSWEFAYIYVGGRILFFSLIHSYFWLKRLQPVAYYFKNSIVVRVYDYFKEWF